MKLLLVLLALGGLVTLGWLTWQWGEPWLWPHRWAILDAFDGHVDPTVDGKYRFECGSSRCETVVPQLPPVSRVRCVQRLIPYGACCLAEFGDFYRGEIHIYRQADGKYLVKPLF